MPYLWLIVVSALAAFAYWLAGRAALPGYVAFGVGVFVALALAAAGPGVLS
jgi:hypothetical protein